MVAGLHGGTFDRYEKIGLAVGTIVGFPWLMAAEDLNWFIAAVIEISVGLTGLLVGVGLHALFGDKQP
jgi:hypothetical protein